MCRCSLDVAVVNNEGDFQSDNATNSRREEIDNPAVVQCHMILAEHDYMKKEEKHLLLNVINGYRLVFGCAEI